MERLACEGILCHLALELDAEGAVSGTGFHPSKGRLPGQLLAPQAMKKGGAFRAPPFGSKRLQTLQNEYPIPRHVLDFPE